MQSIINKIYKFKCPRWEELPDSIFSSEIVEYFHEKFGVIFTEDEILTQSMIQNYVKWKMIPAPKGRKYNKEQIARIIVICIFKQVVAIQDIVDGVDLQKKLMDIPSAYNIFAYKLEKAIQKIFGPLINKKDDEIIFEEYITRVETLGITAIVISFACNLLTKTLIISKGAKNVL